MYDVETLHCKLNTTEYCIKYIGKLPDDLEHGGWEYHCSYSACITYAHDSDGLCYLPKFSILASMFVCLFVCLFVGARRDTGRIVWAINTKLGINMEHTCEKVCILFGVDDITDDVTRSKSRSNLKIVITQSIFELELRSKAQNVGYCTGYLDDIPNFRWHLWRKSSPRPQIFVSFENVAIFNIACIWQQVSNDSM